MCLVFRCADQLKPVQNLRSVPLSEHCSVLRVSEYSLHPATNASLLM